MQFPPCEVLTIGDPAGLLDDALCPLGFSIRNATSLGLDEEQPFPANYSLIISVCSLDTVNDLPGSLIHVRQALSPGGLFLATFTGFGSLPRLRQILLSADGDAPAARIHPQIDTQAASGLMQRAGFARQVVDSRSVTASYRTLDQLVTDLRVQGLTNALLDAPPPFDKAGYARAKRAFDEMRNEEGKVVETFELITVTGWKEAARPG